MPRKCEDMAKDVQWIVYSLHLFLYLDNPGQERGLDSKYFSLYGLYTFLVPRILLAFLSFFFCILLLLFLLHLYYFVLLIVLSITLHNKTHLFPILFMSMDVLNICMSVHQMHLVPTEARRVCRLF